LVQQGNSLVVTTQNGAGTNHSAINWQSFSVPAGSTTQFNQPSATSTSINRVLGSNPSAIYGTLSSNGRLVLVNPSGIAVGAGAVVDTAGFTASTLRMSDADALAGRLVFGGDGSPAGALSVDGRILARSGDVVLIAPNVQVGSDALVQSPSGATLLAAGQKVELTGRGLEGIRLELQAPSDQAINLGTLQGDAVGIFAGQLKHSGLIQATGVSADGGKVVLKGAETADVSGRIAASKGLRGGQVHVTANKVMLKSGAVIDVSGRDGGGEALIGGGWQGDDSRIANASETTIEAGAIIKADAGQSGDGGKVVAWSDDSTRVYGSISARGGAGGGDGGQVETSGKRYLDFAGVADLRAPKGAAGTLLLDPSDITIRAAGPDSVTVTGTFTDGAAAASSVLTTATLNNQLNVGNVLVTTSTGTGAQVGHITVADPITWTTGNTLGLNADNGIDVNAPISGVSGVLALSGGAGNVTQNAAGAISASKMWAHTTGGSIALTNSANAVSTFAAFSNSGGIAFANAGGLVIGSVDAGLVGLGSIAGVRSNNNQPVSLAVSAGSLTISDTSNGINAGSGSVDLQATSGSITESAAGATVKAAALTAAAADIQLNQVNSVASFAATQSGGGGVSLVNSNFAFPLTLNNVTAAGGISITEQLSNIVVDGTVRSGAAGALSLTSASGSTFGGSILQGVNGLLQSDSISLTTAAGLSIGGVPGVGALRTASNSGSTSFTIGGPLHGAGQVVIGHTGSATLGSATLTSNASFAFAASGNLDVNTSLDTGIQALKL